jgi:hypothetical protein
MESESGPIDNPTDEQLREYAEHFADVLRERGIEALACPACGANAWGGFSDVGLPVIDRRKGGEIGPRTLGSIHAVSTTCGQCGFICHFDREIFGG